MIDLTERLELFGLFVERLKSYKLTNLKEIKHPIIYLKIKNWWKNPLNGVLIKLPSPIVKLSVKMELHYLLNKRIGWR